MGADHGDAVPSAPPLQLQEGGATHSNTAPPVAHYTPPAPVEKAAAPQPPAECPDKPYAAPVHGAPVVMGVMPDPSFPNQEFYRLPRCAACREYNGVPGLHGGITFQCFRCGQCTQLPLNWTPPPKKACIIL